MKNTIISKIICFMFFCMTGCFVFSSCDKVDISGDPEIEIEYADLPAEARSFINSYFSTDYVGRVEKEIDDNEIIYEVIMMSGTQIIFNEEGIWQQVDASDGKTIPTGFILSPILDYINEYYAGYGINEINKTGSDFNVELITGLTLLFDEMGEFVKEVDQY